MVRVLWRKGGRVLTPNIGKGKAMLNMNTFTVMQWLSKEFGAEWEALSAIESVRLERDYSSAMDEDDCSVKEYGRRIGRGNLRAYVDCLMAGDARRGRA